MQRISQVWPGWQADELIGRGSYGRVYRASHTAGGHTSQAAIKVIDIPRDESEIASLRLMSMDANSIRSYFEETARSVVREVAVMDSLKGAPNVVSIEDYQLLEREDGVGWTILIRMELLEEDLPKYLKRVGTPLPREVAKIGADICRALAACHGAGVIHRDVKPENVFVSRYGEFKLGDFGLSRRLDEGSRSTKSMAGSSPYMAPEVLGGHYDASVDTYSLGVMLYRWLNGGKPPFIGAKEIPTHALLEDAQARRLACERPPLPGGDGVDSALAGIVRKACEPDPFRRWRTATAFGAALQDWLDGRMVETEDDPHTASEPTGPSSPAYNPLDALGVVGTSTSGSDSTTESGTTSIGDKTTRSARPVAFGTEARGIIASPVSGEAKPMTYNLLINLGFYRHNGVAIEGAEGNLRSPIDGTVTSLSKSSVGLVSSDGIEILMKLDMKPTGSQVGVLKESPLVPKVAIGDDIRIGQLLFSADPAVIKAAGLHLDVMVVATKTPDVVFIDYARGHITAGEKLLAVRVNSKGGSESIGKKSEGNTSSTETAPSADPTSGESTTKAGPQESSSSTATTGPQFEEAGKDSSKSGCLTFFLLFLLIIFLRFLLGGLDTSTQSSAVDLSGLQIDNYDLVGPPTNPL